MGFVLGFPGDRDLVIDFARGVLAQTVIKDLRQSLEIETLGARFVAPLEEGARTTVAESIHEPDPFSRMSSTPVTSSAGSH